MIICEKIGDLIQLALDNEFEVIAHGCNCFNTQKKGFAKLMDEQFETSKFGYEKDEYDGDINKLGCIDAQLKPIRHERKIWIVNMYTQFDYAKNGPYGIPLDYDAIRLCFRKLNFDFKTYTIGIPGLIGCGLAGGRKEIVKKIIEEETKNCKIIIIYPEL